jgi:hypothetical protein
MWHPCSFLDPLREKEFVQCWRLASAVQCRGTGEVGYVLGSIKARDGFGLQSAVAGRVLSLDTKVMFGPSRLNIDP